MTSSLAGFILYFLITVYCIKKFRSRISDYLILFALFFGICLLQISIRIDDFQNTLISLPDFIIHCLGILCGFIYIKTKPIIGVSVTVAGLVFSLYMFFTGYDLWIHKVNFKTFTGVVLEAVPEFKLFDSSNQVITRETFKHKIIVLDFWHTACGVCFKKFPILQQKYDKYKNINWIKFYAVNLPLKRDTVNQAINTIRKLKYTFPVLFVQSDSVVKAFNILSYPTTLIIDNGKSIVYRGDIDGIDKVIENFKNGH